MGVQFLLVFVFFSLACDHGGAPGFSAAVALADAVDERATDFWKERERIGADL